MLSILIFSRNEPGRVKTLVDDLIGIADEIVVIDSSDGEDRKRTESINGGKVKVYHTVPTGFPDIFRTYAFKKCTNEWIFYIDTDEKTSDELKSGIRKLISNTSASGFLINRVNYYIARNGGIKKYGSSDYQLRLFKRSKAASTGYPHEFVKINGNVETINKRMLIEHIHGDVDWHRNLMLTREIPRAKYMNRLSYKDVGELFSKRPASKLLAFFVKRHNPHAEISPFYYKALLIGKIVNRIGMYAKDHEPINMAELYYTYKYEMLGINEFFKEDENDRKLQFDICEEMRKAGGPTKYLSFDKESVIKALNKRKLKEKGIPLMVSLFIEKFNANKNKGK